MRPLFARPMGATSVLGAVLFAWACGSGRDTPTPVAGGTERPGGAGSAAEALQTGFGLLRQGDLKGAEPYLTSALESSPRDRRILEGLGSIYARTDRWKMAEESFQSALAAEPASIGARLGLAAVYVDTGRYDEAAAALQEVRRRDPENSVARVKGALLDARLGRVAEAEAGARAAISRNSDSAEAHSVLGLALEQKGALDEAAAEMRRVHDLSPAHLGALSHLVTIETRLRHGAEAARWRAAQQEALSRAHVEERVRDHRIQGVAAFNREDYTTALQEFQMIAREDILHLRHFHRALRASIGGDDAERGAAASDGAVQARVVAELDGHRLGASQASDMLPVDLDLARVVGGNDHLPRLGPLDLAGDAVTVVQHDRIGKTLWCKRCGK